MTSNVDRYKKDLDALIARGDDLELAIEADCFPTEIEKALQKAHGAKAKQILRSLPSFRGAYQPWYSEAKALVQQLLPNRLADFVGHYEAPKPRKQLTADTYRVVDCLLGLTATREFRGETTKIVGPEAGVPHFRQQLAIVKSMQARFGSSLFDIRQLVQADLFDSELEAAQELARNKFLRAAGAVAGVVLERHLAQVSGNHNVTVTKKAPTISDLNDTLKAADVIDIPQWRFVQHLADIRNLCDHNKASEPTAEQVNDLIAGVMKVTKTIF